MMLVKVVTSMFSNDRMECEKLLERMDTLTRDMNQQKNNEFHFSLWDEEMLTIKTEYHMFQKDVLARINNGDEKLEEVVCPYFEKIGDAYDRLTTTFLDKKEEIKRTTTYYDVKKARKRKLWSKMIIMARHKYRYEFLNMMHQVMRGNHD